MNLQKFLEKYNGQYVETAGSPNALNQCTDLANAYLREVLNHPIVEWTNAKDFPSKLTDFEYIGNEPFNAPKEGDLVIWGGTYGHIAIFLEGRINNFKSFDQNYPIGSPCHVQGHTYSNVLGWLRPKSIISPLQPVNFTDQTIIDLRQYGKHEIQAIRGFYGDALNWQKDLENTRQALKECREKPVEPIFTDNLPIKDLLILLIKKIFK